jgi:hypothetical protein
MSLCVPSRPPSSIHPHVFVTLSLTELPNHPYVETHTRVCTLFVCDRLKVGLESNDGAPADMFLLLLLYDVQLVLFSWQQLISKKKGRNNSAGFPSSLQ